MKAITGTFWQVMFLALLCLAPRAFAQTVDVTSAGSFVYDGDYVSPYYATVNGVPSTAVICDDFADTTTLNTTWSANVTQFSNLSSSLGNTVWGAYYTSQKVAAATIIDWYEEAAWLTLQLLAQPSGSNNQAWYSYAEWAVFDPNSVLSWLKTHGSGGGADTAACEAIFGNACTSTTASAGSFLYNAEQNYAKGNYSNFLILSPTVNGTVCSPFISGSGNCPAQEFLEIVPEGGTAAMYLLLAAVSCLGAMLFRSRRQNARVGSA